MKLIPTKKKGNINRNIFILVMLAWPLLHFLVFSAYVIIQTVIMAFQRESYVTGNTIWCGIDNFKRFFSEFTMLNSDWPKAILNSVGYFPLTNLILLPLSVIAAYFLFRKVPLHGIYRTIFFFPNIISVVVLAMVFRNMLDPTIGPICNMLSSVFGFTDNNMPQFLADPKLATMTLYFYAIWAGIGFNVVLISGAMSRIPTEVLEVGRMDGIGFFKEIFHIIIPIIWPTIATMFIFGAMTVFTQFMHQLVLTPNGVGDTWTIGYLIMFKVQGGADLYYAATLGVFFTAIGLPIILLIKRLVEKVFDVVEV